LHRIYKIPIKREGNDFQDAKISIKLDKIQIYNLASRQIYRGAEKPVKVHMIYHTIGRYLALPTGSIRAGQNSPYFDNYMQEGKYGPGKYDFSYLPVFYFQTYSGDGCRHRFLNIATVLLPASSFIT
jgi:hypothetical protein